MELEYVDPKSSPMLYGIQENYTCISGGSPRSSDYLPALPAGELITTIVCCLVTLATVLMYAEEVYHLQTRLEDWEPKRKALVLLGIYPLTSVNSMFALLMPRTTWLAELCVSLYYALCMFLFSQMVFQHFGGKGNMMRLLQGQTIPLQSPPICCCCSCLPKPPLTMTRLNLIEFCVIQFVIYQPLATYLLALVAIDAGSNYVLGDAADSAKFFQVLSSLDTCSTLLVVYGNVMLYKMSAGALKGVNIKAKFFLLKIVVILENLQKLVLAILVLAGVITCSPPLDTTATSDRLHHQLLIFEMILLAVAARVYYRHDVMQDMPGEDWDQVLPSRSLSVSTTASGYGATDDAARHGDVITTQPNKGETDSYQSSTVHSDREIL